MSTTRFASALFRIRPDALRPVFCNNAFPRPPTNVPTRFTAAMFSTSAGAGRGAARRRLNKRTSIMSTLATWIWRGVYTATGAAIAGGAVLYVTDPKGSQLIIRNIREDIEARIRFFTEPSSEKLLPDLKPPYPGAQMPRTLIIDLDETLVHSSYTRSTGWRIAKRPGAEAFLAYLFNFYEIVLFTSKLPMYVDPILAQLDPNGYISHRLYRPETKFERGVFVKHLDFLNRDLNRVVAIDHDMNTMKYHRENAIEIPKWTGDPTDTALLDLVPFLESLAKEDVADVREHLAILRDVPIKDGVAAHKASAPARMERENEKQGFLFGVASAPNVPPPLPADEDRPKGAVWDSLSGRSSKLFHPSAHIEMTEEAKNLKNQT